MDSLPKSVVFITGSFIGNNCWDEWKFYFESKGYNCLAPAWPHKDASPEELRNAHPDTAITSNRLETVTDFFVKIIKVLPEKPILMGHSIGGLIVQILVHRGLGRVGVAIHSFPPGGLSSLRISFLKKWWQAMGFFSSKRKSYLIHFRKWKYSIANGMDCEEQKELYYKYAIPESKMVIRDAFNCREKIDFKSPHAPLLFISGSKDQMIGAELVYENYKKYNASDSITDYRNFKGRNHLFFDHREWIDEADIILYWLQSIK